MKRKHKCVLISVRIKLKQVIFDPVGRKLWLKPCNALWVLK